MTWDGAHTATNPFADTLDDGPALCFAPGEGQVTAGLDAAVRQLCEGDVARITCSPALAYGDAGNPPHVPPRSFLVYEITVRRVGGEGVALPSGPSTLLGAGLANLPRQSSSRGMARARTVKLLDGSETGGGDVTDEQLRRAAEGMGLVSHDVTSIPEGDDEEEGDKPKYSYAQLLSVPHPPGVDRQHLEHHLKDDEFESVLGRSRKDFAQLPIATQESIKKGKGLL